ncbi:RNA polymerase subunit sigma-70 [Actinoplanes sp. NPDC051633]|uniref:RNA polymerase subunit sigma-70 n=1 Tax=Actinoplanes sp. NPDC051633 TaxID=3155670 RepID=UPI003438A70E
MDSEADFTAQAETHRHELRVHCYRLLGSFDEAEDLVQETLLKAWRRRETFEGRAPLRAWLYRIATNTCLDALDKRPAVPVDVPAQVQPYPDRLLPPEDQPDAVVVSRETVALAFVVAVQHLSPRQRAVVILRDVLGWPARDTAELLGTTVTAVNSMLQRARPVLREHLPTARPAAGEERALVARYMEAIAASDDRALAALLREDVRVSQAPGAGGNAASGFGFYSGRATALAAWAPALHGDGALDWRFRSVRANRQQAFGGYVRRRGTNGPFEAFGLTVLGFEDGQVAEVTVFGNDRLPAFGLPTHVLDTPA